MANGQTGYMQLLPTVIPAGMTVTAITAALNPWHAPAYMGIVGTTPSEGDPVIAITFEWPTSWMRTPTPIEKFDLEWLYLRRYSSDQALATGAHAFADIQAGGDPPDATAQTDEGRLGVESTALTVQGRREVHGIFGELRRRLQSTEPAVFANLRGHLVYVWFGGPHGAEVGKPFKRSDTGSIDDLVRALAEYEPKSEQLLVPGGELPQQAPELPLAETDAGAKFYAIPFLAAVPSSMLFSLAGFDIGVAYTTFLTAQDAWSEIRRLVDSHDKPGVDLLLVTAGGPDARGNIFPVEEAVANFIVEHPLGIDSPPKHIRSVILHSWATGRATTLYPDVSLLFGPLYQSLVPVHHLIHPPQPSAEQAPDERSEERAAEDGS